MENSIREPAMAETFYPADPNKLREMIDQLLNLADGEQISNLHGIIVPHAGYIYSGRTACYAFKKLMKKFDKVIILGPNHIVYTDTGVIDANDYWKTPLGLVKIETIDGFDVSHLPHEKEHSIEVEVPFLQHVIGNNFTLVPIIIGDINDKKAQEFAKNIISNYDEKTLLVISTDLSHFHSIDSAKEIDKKTIDEIINLGNEFNACGENSLKVLIEICKLKDWRINFLDYSTSADATGDKERVVGYASFWF